MHCFELITSNVEYYVGGEKLNSSVHVNVENIDNWFEEEKNWIVTIQKALMPLPTNASSMCQRVKNNSLRKKNKCYKIINKIWQL